MIFRATLAVLFILHVAGCGSPPPTYRSLDDFASLKLSDRSLVDMATLPGAPKGFTDSDVKTLARKLVTMAEEGTYNSDVWHPGSQAAAIDLVLRDLQPVTRRQLSRMALEQLDGRPWASAVGTVFANDVMVVGRPLMQRATWDVGVDRSGDEPWLNVRLQTKVFYAVHVGERRSVITVLHTWLLTSPTPVARFYPAIGFSAHAAGADPCAFILRSVIRPDPNEKRYLAEMKKVLDESATKFVEPSGDSGAATAKRCRDKEA